jgi:hypothetical protein
MQSGLAIVLRVPEGFEPECRRDSIRLNIKLLGNSQTISDHFAGEGQMILANNALGQHAGICYLPGRINYYILPFKAFLSMLLELKQ